MRRAVSASLRANRGSTFTAALAPNVVPIVMSATCLTGNDAISRWRRERLSKIFPVRSKQLRLGRRLSSHFYLLPCSRSFQGSYTSARMYKLYYAWLPLFLVRPLQTTKRKGKRFHRVSHADVGKRSQAELWWRGAGGVTEDKDEHGTRRHSSIIIIWCFVRSFVYYYILLLFWLCLLCFNSLFVTFAYRLEPITSPLVLVFLTELLGAHEQK